MPFIRKPFFSSKRLPLIFFTVLILLAYLPMLGGLMGIKSDALFVSYPIFYFFAEQLQQGTIPFWHYNLNGGFPVHADVGSFFWNFLLWVFPLVSKSLYAYTLLILLHVFIAAAAAYKLARYLKLSSATSYFMAFCYVCSGFYVAHLQHPNNILESAYIPLILLLFLQTIYGQSLRQAIKLGIVLFFFINSGYPGFIISMFYFLFFVYLFILIFSKGKEGAVSLLPAAKYLFTAAVLAILLSLPLLVSFLEVWEYYSRSVSFRVNEITGGGGMTGLSLLSLFWPLASAADPLFYHTDITWNNLYIGVPLLGLFVFSLVKVKNPIKWPLVFAGTILLLMSFQGPVKSFFYTCLPLLSLVRSNGGFRIYFILSAIIVACYGLDSMTDKKNEGIVKKIFMALGLIQIAVVVVLLLKGVRPAVFLEVSIVKNTRAFTEAIQAPTLIFIGCFVNLLLLSAALMVYKKKRYLLLLLSADLLIAFFINLPITGLSTKSTAFLQSDINQAIIDINKNAGDASTSKLADITTNSRYVLAPALFLKDKIRIDNSAYPSIFKTYNYLFSSGLIHNFDNKQSVYFISQKGTDGYLQNVLLGKNAISFDIKSDRKDSIVLFQNYYKNWKCLQDGKEVAISKSAEGFMQVATDVGTHHLVFSYWPRGPVVAFFASLVVWVGVLVYLFAAGRKVRQGGGSLASISM